MTQHNSLLYNVMRHSVNAFDVVSRRKVHPKKGEQQTSVLGDVSVSPNETRVQVVVLTENTVLNEHKHVC